ncbi:unnamed protein product [Mytilus coruscus]|uniref:Uncharacterized protein n=1 Tax=Mytilus coruscus TaxID=42192 RepID=A0A6J8BUP5_MYTCO|nr:unnamed protein product [Mytilus coruscus]
MASHPTCKSSQNQVNELQNRITEISWKSIGENEVKKAPNEKNVYMYRKIERFRSFLEAINWSEEEEYKDKRYTTKMKSEPTDTDPEEPIADGCACKDKTDSSSEQSDKFNQLLVDIDIMGQRLPNRGFLIVKDPIDSYTRMRKENVPERLGMNVIGLCKKLLQQDYGNQYPEEVTEIEENFKLREFLKASDKNEHCNSIEFIKLCSNSPVRIPANSVTILNGTGPN